MKDDITIALVDIARSGAISAGAKVTQTAEEIVTEWRVKDTLQEAKQILGEFKIVEVK